jgi:predicted PhzF superfamily epimerase YddE/YHI9
VPLPPALSAALGVRPVGTATEGNNYLALLRRADDVRSLEPDLAAIARLDRTGVVVTAVGDGTHDFVSRYFAPAKGIPEDPVTGGAHCALVPFWAARTGRDSFFAYQASRRGGELACRLVGDRVQLDGACKVLPRGPYHDLNVPARFHRSHIGRRWAASRFRDRTPVGPV